MLFEHHTLVRQTRVMLEEHSELIIREGVMFEFPSGTLSLANNHVCRSCPDEINTATVFQYVFVVIIFEMVVRG